MAKTHIIFGVSLTLLSAKFGIIDYSIPNLVLGALGSLLPDIDHPKSVIGSRLLPISYPISKIFGHRGITHSLFAIILMMIAIQHYAHSASWAAALAIGYLSHLLGDMMTPSGVPLFYPSRKKFRFPIGFKTNSGLETVFSVVLMCGTAWFIVH